MSNGLILVVEDSQLERETMLMLLRRAGHTASGVADVESALAALENSGDEIDVVLSDLRLGSETGVDLLRRWQLTRPSTPFIFVSGVCEVAQVVEAVKLGAEDYIAKPYNSAELLRRVAECIEAGRDDSPVAANGDRASDGEPWDRFASLPDDATLEELERAAIELALQRCGDNRTHAAEKLAISVRTLQRKLKSWYGASTVNGDVSNAIT